MKDIAGISIRALLLLLATILALEIVLQLAFPHLPKMLTEYMPQYLERMGHRLDTEHGAHEYPAWQVVEYDVTPLSGDMYHLTCLSPADAQPFEPYQVSFKRDRHGFRNAEPWPEEVDMVVLGDSFTAAELVQRPYWQNLSESMLVLAVPGAGTLEQQRLFDAFALPRKPETVLLAFFAGNDLGDNESFAEMISEGLTRRDLLHHGKNPLDYSVVFRLLQYIAEATTTAPARQLPLSRHGAHGSADAGRFLSQIPSHTRHGPGQPDVQRGFAADEAKHQRDGRRSCVLRRRAGAPVYPTKSRTLLAVPGRGKQG